MGPFPPPVAQEGAAQMSSEPPRASGSAADCLLASLLGRPLLGLLGWKHSRKDRRLGPPKASRRSSRGVLPSCQAPSRTRHSDFWDSWAPASVHPQGPSGGSAPGLSVGLRSCLDPITPPERLFPPNPTTATPAPTPPSHCGALSRAGSAEAAERMAGHEVSRCQLWPRPDGQGRQQGEPHLGPGPLPEALSVLPQRGRLL